MNITKPLIMNEKKSLLKGLVADLKQYVPNLEATVERVSNEAIEMAGYSAEFICRLQPGPECDERCAPSRP